MILCPALIPENDTFNNNNNNNKKINNYEIAAYDLKKVCRKTVELIIIF